MSEQESSQQDDLVQALQPLLGLLYRPDTAGELAGRLAAIAGSAMAGTIRLSTSMDGRPMLITYGDTLRNQQEAPLAILHQFNQPDEVRIFHRVRNRSHFHDDLALRDLDDRDVFFLAFLLRRHWFEQFHRLPAAHQLSCLCINY